VSQGSAAATPRGQGAAAQILTWRWALAATLFLTFLRLVALRNSPLELYPDEAQYWVWSRDLALGYFSKPPMIAWIIRLTTWLAGDAEPFVRMSSPLLHGAAALCLYAAGRRLYSAGVGFLALLIYLLAPGGQLGAFVVSTDTPLCAFLAAALWLYVLVWQSEGRSRLAAAAGFGAALGQAFLSKYAALYAVIGVGLHLALSRDARRMWTWSAALAAAAAFAVVIGPNLAWNASHGFATVAHTASNAGWDRRQLFNPLELASFLGSQFGVFGPAPFAILVGGGTVLAWRRRLQPADLMLLCWTLPPLAIIAVEAFIARANANWAAAAYVPAAVVVAAWLLRWRWRWLAILIVASQAVIALMFLLAVSRPNLVDAVGGANALKRVRGWRQITTQMVQLGRAEALAAPFTAAAVDDRFLYNEAAYYGRNYFGQDGPPLRFWTPGGPAENQAEMVASLTPAEGGRVLAASLDGANTAAMQKSFTTSGPLVIVSESLDAKHSRRLDIFVGEGLRPRP